MDGFYSHCCAEKTLMHNNIERWILELLLISFNQHREFWEFALGLWQLSGEWRNKKQQIKNKEKFTIQIINIHINATHMTFTETHQDCHPHGNDQRSG